MPGLPASALVVIETDLGLSGLESFFDRPTTPGDGDQRGQWDGLGRPAPVERQLAGIDAAAYEQTVALGFLREGTLREDCVVDGEVSDSWVYGLIRRQWRPPSGSDPGR